MWSTWIASEVSIGARQMPQNKEPPLRTISAACERTAAALR
jgi:hypothetical protein